MIRRPKLLAIKTEIQHEDLYEFINIRSFSVPYLLRLPLFSPNFVPDSLGNR
jgi:hypothetical protein